MLCVCVFLCVCTCLCVCMYSCGYMYVCRYYACVYIEARDKPQLSSFKHHHSFFYFIFEAGSLTALEFVKLAGYLTFVS